MELKYKNQPSQILQSMLMLRHKQGHLESWEDCVKMGIIFWINGLPFRELCRFQVVLGVRQENLEARQLLLQGSHILVYRILIVIQLTNRAILLVMRGNKVKLVFAIARIGIIGDMVTVMHLKPMINHS